MLKTCSFCGLKKENIVSSPYANICFDCIKRFGENIPEEAGEKRKKEFSPQGICKYLDDYVVGQDYAKKVLSVAVYNHYKRVLYNPNRGEITKSNVLLIGKTGVGKTLLAETLARFLDVPFSISDATSLTEAGYVGEDVENVILRLLESCDFDIGKAEKGIVYVDEIDKITRKTDSPSITRDVSGEGVQQALLKIMEGCTANVPPHGGRKHPEQSFVKVNTGNILFICGGTFDGLEQIIERRIRGCSIGFKNFKEEEKTMQPEPEDLIKYGFIPEFVGRLPVIATLEPLDKKALVRILTEPRNALTRQYRKLFEIEGVELEFDDSALETVAGLAIQKGTGARGLRTILEDAMLDIMYELPAKKNVKGCVITKETIIDKKPKYEFYKKTA